jgi:CHASE1-domain containing sensor protein
VQQALDSQREVIEDLGALFETGLDVDREAFGRFVRGTLARHDTIQALEWIPAVQHAGRESFEASLKAWRPEACLCFPLLDGRRRGGRVGRRP